MIYLIDKPAGISSNHAVQMLRRQLQEKKIGHAGTLDPFATGLLVCGYRSSNRLLQYLQLEPKVYHATIVLGVESPTLDPEQAQIMERPPLPTDAQIRELLKKLEQQREQIPPKYSALHIDGKRAYERVRAGEEIEIPARAINGETTLTLLSISRAEHELWDGYPQIELRAAVGSGYYIRSLARDHGQLLGVSAICSALRREQLGGFSVSDAIAPDLAVRDDGYHLQPDDFCIPSTEITTKEARALRNGQIITDLSLPEGQQYVLWNDIELVGIGTKTEDGLKSQTIIPQES